MRHQEIIFGLAGQTFYFDPLDGPPTAVGTVQVFASMNDDDGGAVEAATTGACSTEGIALNLDVAATRGDSTITVSSTALLIPGRQYLLMGQDGVSEWIEVKGLPVNTTNVTLRRPLSNSFVADSTLRGTRISINVSDTWAATKSKLTDIVSTSWRTDEEPDGLWPAGATGYRLRWAYTNYSGKADIGTTYADLVRYSSKNFVLPSNVDARFPGWIDRLPTDYQSDQGSALIGEAFAAVRLDALGDAQVLRRVRDMQVLHELVVLKANVLALEASASAGATTRDAVQVGRDLYQQRYDQLIREPKVPIDQTGGGASAPARRLPVWRR